MFFILHFSFFIEFCFAKFLWASRFARFAGSRRAIRSITLCALRARAGASPAPTGGSATIPLAKNADAKRIGVFFWRISQKY
jgi:hypothetical protein